MGEIEKMTDRKIRGIHCKKNKDKQWIPKTHVKEYKKSSQNCQGSYGEIRHRRKPAKVIENEIECNVLWEREKNALSSACVFPMTIVFFFVSWNMQN